MRRSSNRFKNELKKEKRMRLAGECKALSTTVFVNGIGITQAALDEGRPETQEETNEKVTEMIGKLKLDARQAGIYEVHRLPSRILVNKEGKDFLSNTVKIVFKNFDAKQGIYKAFARNGAAVKGIRVNDAIPKELLMAKKNLEDICAK